MVYSAQHAKILGVTVADKFLFTGTLHVPLHAKVVILVFVLISMTTTYLTVRQSMKRGMMPAATPDNPMGAVAEVHGLHHAVVRAVRPVLAVRPGPVLGDDEPVDARPAVRAVPDVPAAARRGGAGAAAGDGDRPGASTPAATGPAEAPARPSGIRPGGRPGGPGRSGAGRAPTEPRTGRRADAASGTGQSNGAARTGAARRQQRQRRPAARAARPPPRRPPARRPGRRGQDAQASANGSGGVLRRLGKGRAEPEPPPPEPEVKLVRQQKQRQSRSKRSGKR